MLESEPSNETREDHENGVARPRRDRALGDRHAGRQRTGGRHQGPGNARRAEFYAELVAQFEKETGHKVSTNWAGTVDVTKRISGGETVDLVIMARNSLEELIRLGKIYGEPRRRRRDGIGLGVGGRSRPTFPRVMPSTDAARRQV